jgi:hypothetical protein
LRSLAWLDLGAWIVTLVELIPRLGESALEPWLAAIGLIGLAAALAWLRGLRGWRALVVGAAVLHIVGYAVRFYVLQVDPLLVILPLHQALSDALYVVWSSPVLQLSLGDFRDGGAELWREFLMPLVQLGVASVALRAR